MGLSTGSVDVVPGPVSPKRAVLDPNIKMNKPVPMVKDWGWGFVKRLLDKGFEVEPVSRLELLTC